MKNLVFFCCAPFLLKLLSSSTTCFLFVYLVVFLHLEHLVYFYSPFLLTLFPFWVCVLAFFPLLPLRSGIQSITSAAHRSSGVGYITNLHVAAARTPALKSAWNDAMPIRCPASSMTVNFTTTRMHGWPIAWVVTSGRSLEWADRTRANDRFGSSGMCWGSFFHVFGSGVCVCVFFPSSCATSCPTTTTVARFIHTLRHASRLFFKPSPCA